MSIRSIERNKLKAQVGSNKIRSIWRKRQIKKFGLHEWVKNYRATVSKLMDSKSAYDTSKARR